MRLEREILASPLRLTFETRRLALRHRVTVVTDCAARGWNGGFPERARESTPPARARRLIRRRERRESFRDARDIRERAVSSVRLGSGRAPENERAGRARGVRGVGDERADEYAGQQEPARARAFVAPPARVPDARARGRRGRRPRADGGARQIRVSGRVPSACRVRVAARRLRRSRSDDGGVHGEEGPARATCVDAASHAGGARISGDNHS